MYAMPAPGSGARPVSPVPQWQTLGADTRLLPCDDEGAEAYRFGPVRLADGRVRFRLWAPDAAAQDQPVRLEVAGMTPVMMAPTEHGWFEAVTACCDGARYWFRLDDGTIVPDPASRLQADDVHGASVLCQPAEPFPWQHTEWRGRPWHEAVIYEMHVGLAGGYAGATAQLHRLAALGFTTIELMPLAEFPGARNWGYDGVLPFAPERSYGTPDELRTLVDTAHGLGMMVLIDVVYNHFGPEGNYLHRYASPFFRTDRQTPWGPAIDFRRPEVRRFFGESARYWLESFRFDGLRLDAVHAIEDEGWLPQLAHDLRQCLPGRHLHLVLENDHNDAALLAAGYDAQWNDDAHHALHVLLTGEHDGYYKEYHASLPESVAVKVGDDKAASTPPIRHLARVLAEGFAWQSEVSPHRSGDENGPLQGREVRRGQPSAHLPPTAFVTFLQNHDQTGNRAFGERLASLAEPDALRAAVALQLLCPQIPLVFMGEEHGARTPFLYFTDHPPELAQAVRDGRRREFAASEAFRDDTRSAQIADPNAPETFEASRPICDDTDGYCRAWNHYYGELLSIRRNELMPRLRNARAEGVTVLGDKALVARWRLGDGSRLSIWLNLGEEPVVVDCEGGGGGAMIHASQPGAIATLAAGTLPEHCCVTCLQRP
ncbi:malto-oligosyltrehalose trehalohydrolase [Cupriavidus campinensis]|uniref:Malto-oligosyltrehalose trehalohydrolase n=1 Tax=Cupriavidus campinensis TaxID=151783 RepID=A0AAE9I6D0_9BURK|nr:malto-oligosyltrehalose trehalohydrolase [Cupriavidus campinensis]URF08124.1 malto-oligosyltrehalose trehalohydrolase [Cupriavidus campinensis]